MIYVKMPDSYQVGNNIESWGLVELQGDLESTSGTPNAGKFIGDLHYNKNGTPVLIIGHHILTGKEIPLPRPLAALRKTIKNNDFEVEYVIEALITHKLFFKSRPKPIIENDKFISP